MGVAMKHKPFGPYEHYIKRPMDCILAIVALILLSPIIFAVGILVKLKLGTPVIFKQERPGKDEKSFMLYKFRSMSEEKDAKGELLPDEVRLNQFGRFLRSSSLDELPELVNIVKGDMSIIGPRPLAMQYLDYYTEEERKRHEVRPGLSGLAQVNGRTALNWEKRFEYDIAYVNKITFLGDMLIVFKTITKVFARDGIVEAEIQGDFDEYRRKQLEEGTVRIEKRERNEQI